MDSGQLALINKSSKPQHPFDVIDLIFGILGAVTAPVSPIPFGLAIAQYFARRSAMVARALLAAMDAPLDLAAHPYTQALLPGAAKLLPAGAAASDAAAPETTGGASEAGDDPFAAPVERRGGEIPFTIAAHLRRLPRVVGIVDMKPYPASSTSLPLGIDVQGERQWIDLQTTTLHVGLYGQSGCGKDNLLRVWFLYLCKANPPESVQFVFLDGKGDWLTANLASLAHMFLAPAGGYGRLGDEHIRAAIAAIDAEAARRQHLITAAGCRTREQYVARTGEVMPLLVVVATDVMTSIADAVEGLLTALVSKARSLGIRVIISMQTPTGKDTRWRSNLSTVLAGSLQSGSQDEPALGIAPRDMVYRPSQLPSPQERPGVFVVRSAATQLLVQAPYLNEARFDALCATLPVRPTRPAAPANYLLAALLDVSNISSTIAGAAHEANVRPESMRAAFFDTRAADPNAVQVGTDVRRAGTLSLQNLGSQTESWHGAPSLDELRKTGKALTLRAQGTTKEQAICTAWQCTKGSNKTWKRASWLFDQALIEQIDHDQLPNMDLGGRVLIHQQKDEDQ